MQNLCLGIQKFIFSCPAFFSSFRELCAFFEKLLNHGPLNTSDQTGLFVLRESHVARMHRFVFRPEMRSP